MGKDDGGLKPIPVVPNEGGPLSSLFRFRRAPLEHVRHVAQFGNLVRWRFGWMWFHQANAPSLVHEILVKQASAFRKTPRNKAVFRDVLGEGLLVSDGEYWRRQRRLVGPAFHSQRISSYGQTMVDHTLKMLAGWHPDDKVDLGHEMMKLTLGIVVKTLFDAEMDEAVFDQVGEAVTVAQETGNARFRKLVELPRWVPTAAHRRTRAAAETLDSVILGLISQRRAEGVDHGDLLSMMLVARDEGGSRGMTDRQAKDEAMTLFLAGHETTALALTWGWVLLNQSPDVKARMRAEVVSVAGDGPLRVEDLPQLTYTEKVVKEVLRVYPPAWIIARQAAKPVQLGDYELPKGAVVMISPYGLHHDPRYFERPDVFDPERFDPAREEALPRFAYIPFGGGPRICIGNSFAMMEARLILATMAQRIDLESVFSDPVEPDPLITLRTKKPVIMEVKRVREFAR